MNIEIRCMLALDLYTHAHINIMSFFNIKDPKKRDAVVADYLATVKRLQQRN